MKTKKAPAKKILIVRIADIETDAGLQARAAYDEDAIRDYGERYKAKEPMPPIVLFKDSESRLWPADGRHRIRGCESQGVRLIEAEIRDGERRDALLYACCANQRHGVKRTSADKRRAVKLLLSDKEWSQWADAEIARRCGVSNHLVMEVKDDMPIMENSKIDTKKVERKKGGKTQTYTMKPRGGDGASASTGGRITFAPDKPPDKPAPPEEWITYLPIPVERAINRLRRYAEAQDKTAECAEHLESLTAILHIRKRKK